MAERPAQNSMLSYEAALSKITDVKPLGSYEAVELSKAADRILAHDVSAKLDQPPRAVSSMDGYAVRASDVVNSGKQLVVVGEVAAGDTPGTLTVGENEAARIFTGAPVPPGADCVVIQENVTQHDSGAITVEGDAQVGKYIRPAAYDFSAGQMVLKAGRALRSSDLALAAASGHDRLDVMRKPKVAVISTGNELVEPGSMPGPGQIISSNAVGVCALVEKFGGIAENLGIVRDDLSALVSTFQKAMELQVDVLVTLGGASVGDHDLVRPALQELGGDLDFWKVAVRPGKPLMYGHRGDAHILGLPGNPVSSLVCAHIFLRPLIQTLMGRPSQLLMQTGILNCALPKNGPRRHFMRATIEGVSNGLPLVQPLEDQDSSLLTRLSGADVLINVPPHQPDLPAENICAYIALD